MVNAATVPCDKIRHDTLDDLAHMTLAYFRQDCQTQLWKRDISKAFRRVPVRADHLVFAWTVWLHKGGLMVAQHKGMPFGTVSAVYAWHRVGFMLCCILRALFLCPAARYVDDFFGASRLGIQWHAGRVLTVISKLLGFPVDDDKSAAISHGNGGNDETSLCIGRLWLEVAAAGVDLHVGRVESAANIADGPTRDTLRLLAQLQATFVPPELPCWLQALWGIPSAEL